MFLKLWHQVGSITHMVPFDFQHPSLFKMAARPAYVGLLTGACNRIFSQTIKVLFMKLYQQVGLVAQMVPFDFQYPSLLKMAARRHYVKILLCHFLLTY